MVHDFDRPVNVTGYDPEYGSKVFRNVTSVLANDLPWASNSYLLVINKSIHLDHLEHHFMCPMQCKTNGININETPKYQSKAPDESAHAFQVEYSSDEDGGMLSIPFQLIGFKRYFPVQKPTKAKWEDDLITKI